MAVRYSKIAPDSSAPSVPKRKRSSALPSAASSEVRSGAWAGLYSDRVEMRLRALHREGASAHGHGGASAAGGGDGGDDDLDFVGAAVRGGESAVAAAVAKRRQLSAGAKKKSKDARSQASPNALSAPGRRRKRSFQEIERSRRFVRPLRGVLEDLAAEAEAAAARQELPDPTFLSATVPPSAYPPRHWCAMCGEEARYRCPACASRTCSLRCSTSHPCVGGVVR